MSRHCALIKWSCDTPLFAENKYSRAHSWTFDGGMTVAASSSPTVVPEPWSDAANIDPEEAFVASLSSCHMLWFLSITSSQGFIVKSYIDNAEGVMAKNALGKLAITQVTLNPKAVFETAKSPGKAELASLHEAAHGKCFIANSINSNITINPDFDE
jgi:organic hydroperoxide reductase OsmC/OhrA